MNNANYLIMRYYSFKCITKCCYGEKYIYTNDTINVESNTHQPVAFTVVLFTIQICLESGVDTSKIHDCGVDMMHSGVDTSF